MRASRMWGLWPVTDASVIAFLIATLIVVSSCNNNTGPDARVRRANYPKLASSSTPYHWLVVKCQLSDVADIPAGLDHDIEEFLGLAGTGYGNLIDYFYDVSYGNALLMTAIRGWTRAPFVKADFVNPTGRLSNPIPGRQHTLEECLSTLPDDQLSDLDSFYGVIGVGNYVTGAGACDVGKITLTVKGIDHQLGCAWFDPDSLFTAFAAHEVRVF